MTYETGSSARDGRTKSKTRLGSRDEWFVPERPGRALRFTKDELLTNIMIYWATETIGSSDVPAGFAIFPKDISQPPREWAERFFNIQRWTPMPSGGHFGAMEEPELLVDDIRAFVRPLRSSTAVGEAHRMEAAR